MRHTPAWPRLVVVHAVASTTRRPSATCPRLLIIVATLTLTLIALTKETNCPAPSPRPATHHYRCFCRHRRYFVGRHIVIRATRGLGPGDVIAENYGPIFTKRTLAERQRTLAARYWFRCTCNACQEDWPRFENLTNDSARLR